MRDDALLQSGQGSQRAVLVSKALPPLPAGEVLNPTALCSQSPPTHSLDVRASRLPQNMALLPSFRFIQSTARVQKPEVRNPKPPGLAHLQVAAEHAVLRPVRHPKQAHHHSKHSRAPACLQVATEHALHARTINALQQLLVVAQVLAGVVLHSRGGRCQMCSAVEWQPEGQRAC